MLAPRHYGPIARYLDGIDAAASERMLRKVPPDEGAFTNDLCSLMDAETQLREGRPSFNIEHLNAELRADGDDLAFTLDVTTHPHNSVYENRVSQSDFGLILEYRNLVLGEHWSKAYLVQAKRVYPGTGGFYDMGSAFSARDPEQHRRIEVLRQLLGPGAILYGLYTPPLSRLAAAPCAIGRALRDRSLQTEIYDYAAGLAFRDWIMAQGARDDPGVWLTLANWLPSRLRDVHERAYAGALPLTWFILHHFSAPRSGIDRLARSRDPDDGQDPTSKDEDWVRGVVTGREDAVERLLEETSRHEGGSGKVLPAHSMTIGVTVGGSLDDGDVRRRD